MKPVINLFRISIHPEQRDEFLGCLANLAQASKELGEDLVSFYGFQSPEQGDLYLVLEIFSSNQAYLQFLNSDTYKDYKDQVQVYIREQAYIRLEGLVLLEKLSKELPQAGSGLRLSLFQAEQPDSQAMDRLNRLIQEYVFAEGGPHAFYLSFDQQSPKDWYQIEIFSDQKEEDLLEGNKGFDHDQVTLRWEPQEILDFPLAMDVVETRGIELMELDFISKS